MSKYTNSEIAENAQNYLNKKIKEVIGNVEKNDKALLMALHVAYGAIDWANLFGDTSKKEDLQHILDFSWHNWME